MELKELSRFEIREVYKKYLKKDFVANELRPLSMIEAYLDDNEYLCVGLYQNQVLLSVAFMYRFENLYLLDYLDTLEKRGQGYGSLLIQKLQELDVEGIYVEVESVKDQDLIQRRRQDFYKKNGFVDTMHRIKLYFVDYDIFYLPIKKDYEQNGILHLYDAMYPKSFQKAFIRIKQ